ncbi:MAG: rRNA maturation RNase YbeY [Spirochaetota bacterium]
MKEVELSSENVEPPQWMPDLAAVAERVYHEIDRQAWEVAVLLCDETRIQELNETYRKASGPTDVLTFSHHEEEPRTSIGSETTPISGDIAISLPIVEANALAFDVAPTEEFLRVYVHALLHLAGYTHEGVDLTSAQAHDHPMLGLQERLVAALIKEHHA